MRYKLYEILRQRNIDNINIPWDDLYLAGMDNVKSEIEFYFDKKYTCESVIQELFIRGVIKYIEKKKTVS
jgi:hypothetical protein